MKRYALLCVVAYVVTGFVMTVSYLVIGAAPLAAIVGGVAGGFVGLLGASVVLLLVELLRRRDAERELDEALEWLRKEQESDYDEPTEHEGLRRLHEDLRRDEEQHE